ncbi:hypothetical protein STEG23_025878, partial [Scotinomys teguina]
MQNGSGGGAGGDCGFKSAQGALESAVQSFVAKHSGAADPGAGGTGQPAARAPSMLDDVESREATVKDGSENWTFSGTSLSWRINAVSEKDIRCVLG